MSIEEWAAHAIKGGKWEAAYIQVLQFDWVVKLFYF